MAIALLRGSIAIVFFSSSGGIGLRDKAQQIKHGKNKSLSSFQQHLRRVGDWCGGTHVAGQMPREEKKEVLYGNVSHRAPQARMLRADQKTPVLPGNRGNHAV
ncbi:hypothetical protein [Burkholderia glumae]|uniref:Uncharacterized protein n=1 Tax=Burkholderia glumae TaxID=337 RepID=A0AAP9XZ50_BURGL|nr:hypothetical protein [Burkholderia glumae]MCM2484538.1 hypothetical protein [Burkholderia glumae]MCM2494918.1 hypothetical protein [Burkholderia glumae]MCM2510230.1 hypothetical protein [Burkholderia glumae]MCM2539995.1 hypothetical protein [Burkholderia glumae]MCM2545783.1 hypothetical protein [Burkholderia glumae]